MAATDEGEEEEEEGTANGNGRSGDGDSGSGSGDDGSVDSDTLLLPLLSGTDDPESDSNLVAPVALALKLGRATDRLFKRDGTFGSALADMRRFVSREEFQACASSRDCSYAQSTLMRGAARALAEFATLAEEVGCAQNPTCALSHNRTLRLAADARPRWRSLTGRCRS